MKTMKPQYQHDCDRCTFIANVGIFGCTIDLYKSCSRNEPGYIVRHSDAPPDYSSYPDWTDRGVLGVDLQGNPVLMASYKACELIEQLAKPEELAYEN